MKQEPTPLLSVVYTLAQEIDGLMQRILDPLLKENKSSVTVKRSYSSYISHMDVLLDLNAELDPKALFAAGKGLISHGDALIQLFEKSKAFNPEYAPLTEQIQSLFERLRYAIQDIQVSAESSQPAPKMKKADVIKDPEPEDEEKTEDRFRDQIIGYSADGPSSDDRLGVSTDVRWLSSIIIAKDWFPPLSIGLFGDWGSGKSSFMLMMQEEIKKLVGHARGVDSKDTAYIQNVAQIRINAWHCMDTNLWANLAIQIMEGISKAVFDSLPENENYKIACQKDLLSQLTITQKQIEDLETSKTLIQSNLNQSQTDYTKKIIEADALKNKIENFRSLKKEEWLALMEESPEIKQDYDAISDQLHLDTTRAVPDQIDDLIQSQRTIQRRISGLWDWGKRNPLPFFMAVFLGCLLFGTLFLFGTWSDNAVFKLTTALIEIGGFLALINPYLTQLSEFLNRAEKIKTVTQSVAETKKHLLQSQLSAEEDRLAAVASRLEEIRQEETLLEQRIEDIRAGKHIEAFLHSRIANADYKDQLGIIAMIRQDFEQLSKMLKAGFKFKKPIGDSPPTAVTLDRVAIYIDDLDRCTPKRVVEVLEAVHLLLAIDFFVVVVAVDPRWLLNSLQWHYRELFTSGSDNLQVSEEEKTAWESTPHNYMDKIFQIPFTLKPMKKKGYIDLIDGLITIPEKPVTPDLKTIQPPPEQIDPGLTIKEIPEPKTDPDEPKPDLNPVGMTLTRIEKQLLSKLQPLLQTPRSAKRLINTYRLIRAPFQGKALRRFVDEDTLSGEFVCVQILLGILIGFPNLAPDIFHSLEKQKSKKFWQFIDQLKPKQGKTTSDSNLVKKGLTERESINWLKFHTAMTDFCNDIQTAGDDLKNVFELSSNLDVYRKWMKEVARYSFRAGYVVSKLNR